MTHPHGRPWRRFRTHAPSRGPPGVSGRRGQGGGPAPLRRALGLPV